MSQHRCSRCKEDQGEYGTRHKYHSGLLCDHCKMMVSSGHGQHRGIFGGLWNKLVHWIHRLASTFRRETVVSQRAQARAIHHQQKTLEAKALSIPRDLSSSVRKRGR